MAVIRNFVSIKPFTSVTSVGINLNVIRKGINRTGMLVEGISKNYAETAKLIKFEREWLHNATDENVSDIQKNEKLKTTRFKKSLAKRASEWSRKNRDDSESEAEKGAIRDENKIPDEVKKPIKSFLEAIGSLLGNIAKYFLIFGALNWLESNSESAVKFFKLVYAIGKFAFQLTKIGVGGVMDGLTNMFGDFSNGGLNENIVKRGLRFFLGALQFAGGLAMLRFASYLIMPWKLFQDMNLIRSIFVKNAMTEAEMKASAEARKTGYRDKKTGIIYTKEEYNAIKKSARRADAKRAKKAGKGMSSDLYESQLGDRFQSQYDPQKKGKLSKFQQRGRIAGKKMTRGISKFAKANPGKVMGGLSVLGGGLRIASGLAMGESAGEAVGAGVGQAAGGILGGIAGTALLGPFLGPFAPLVGSAIGSVLGEFVGKSIGPIIEPIFKPLGRYFGMLMKVWGAVMTPLTDAFGETFSALFDFIGQLGKILIDVAGVLWDFYKMVYGPIFSVIGETISLVIDNAKRITDPGSMAQGYADSLTFNLFDFDKKNKPKKAAGGPVPHRAIGGPVPQGSEEKAISDAGMLMLGTIKGTVSSFGFAGSGVASFINSDVTRLGGVFGGKSTVPAPSGLSSNKVSATLEMPKEGISKTGSSGPGADEQLYRAVTNPQSGMKGILDKTLTIFERNSGKEESSKPVTTTTTTTTGGGGGGEPGVGDPGNVDTSGIKGGGHAKGLTIAKKLMSDFKIKAPAAAGIVGNLMHESGLQPDNVENGKGFKDGAVNNIPVGTQRVGYGWGQWTNDRLERIRGFFKKRGMADKPATDADNYAYLHNELSTVEPVKGHWYNWQGKNIPEDDPSKAATWFMMNWERPGKPHLDARQKYAVALNKDLQKMAKGGKIRRSTPGMGEPAKQVYEKLEEKILEKRKDLQGFAKGGLLSTNGSRGDVRLSPATPFSQYNLHHNKPDTDRYNNARLGGAPIVPRDYVVVRDFGNQGLDRGAPVVAGVDGKVVVAGGAYNTVVIKKGGKDRMQFHHFDSITTRVGQMVTDSTVIGKQGNKPEGIVHVHLDATPSDHRSYVAAQMGGKFDASSMIEAGQTAAPGSGGGATTTTTTTQEAKAEPDTIENREKALITSLEQFFEAIKGISGGSAGLEPSPQKPLPAAGTTASPTSPAKQTIVPSAITPASQIDAKKLQAQKALAAKAAKDKDSATFVPPLQTHIHTVQPQVINTGGNDSGSRVVHGITSPMLTGRPKGSN